MPFHTGFSVSWKLTSKFNKTENIRKYEGGPINKLQNSIILYNSITGVGKVMLHVHIARNNCNVGLVRYSF